MNSKLLLNTHYIETEIEIEILYIKLELEFEIFLKTLLFPPPFKS